MPINDWKEAAKRLLACDTTPKSGNIAIIQILKELLDGAGCNIGIKEVERNGVKHANLIAKRGDGPGGLLLLTHVDTDDPPAAENWKVTGQNPFNPVIADKRIYGLGAADSKLDWLAKVVALHRLSEVKLTHPLLLAATYGEQIGFLGARQLMASGEVRSQYASVAVPSDLNVIYSHKGYLIVKVTIGLNKKVDKPVAGAMPVTRLVCKGKDAHSSAAHLGDNAILKALHVLDGFYSRGITLHVVGVEGGRFINRVPDICLVDIAGEELLSEDLNAFAGKSEDVYATAITKVTEGANMSPMLRHLKNIWRGWTDSAALLEPIEDKAFEPSKVMTTLSTLNGTAESISFTMDARLLPEHDPEDMVTALDGLLRDMEYHHPDLKTEFEIILLSRGLTGSPKSEMVKESLSILKDLSVSAKATTVSGTTEAQIVSSYNLETIVFGPGSIKEVGSPDESIPIADFEKAVDFYERLIRRFCT